MAVDVDDVDRAILAELQRDGRLPITELARRVSLSASTAGDRVRRLEQAGVITGYRAEVDPAALGYGLLAVVRLKYPGNRHEPLHRLLARRREVVECLRTTGEDCYTLQVLATSMAHLEQVVDELNAFGSTTTDLVYSRPLPFRGPPTGGTA
jgi:Lrp/AsnC family transcriptional regulator, leucine-responsive regulatory protein